MSLKKSGSSVSPNDQRQKAFIGAAKQRGMGKSLYRGIKGYKIWTALGQTAYNLRNFYLLYIEDSIEEDILRKLGIFP